VVDGIVGSLTNQSPTNWRSWPSLHLPFLLSKSSTSVEIGDIISIVPQLIHLIYSISISAVYIVASKTKWLDDDPILWFVLMLMSTGPPATKLTALADVSGADEDEKMSIAKFVAMSYMLSPIICFAVVGSLKASLAVTS
jgi:hypothetical protein